MIIKYVIVQILKKQNLIILHGIINKIIVILLIVNIMMVNYILEIL